MFPLTFRILIVAGIQNTKRACPSLAQPNPTFARCSLFSLLIPCWYSTHHRLISSDGRHHWWCRRGSRRCGRRHRGPSQENPKVLRRGRSTSPAVTTSSSAPSQSSLSMRCPLSAAELPWFRTMPSRRSVSRASRYCSSTPVRASRIPYP